MSNFEKASNLATEWVESMGGLEAIRHDYGSDLSGLMQALDDAGLLAQDFSNVTRITVVGGAGRLFETWDITNVAVALQDDGQTLKIFYREEQGNE